MQDEVSFRLAGGAQPLILIPVRVNGAGTFEFILDTGAGTTLISPELARQLCVVETDFKEGVGAGGRVRVGLGQVESLEVGSARIEDLEVAITDELQRIGLAVGAKIDGDAGYNFLKNFRVTIDYARYMLRLDQASVGMLESLAIENAAIRGVQVMVSDVLTMLGQAIGARLDGIVGYNYLKEFKDGIDYPHEMLTLE